MTEEKEENGTHEADDEKALSKRGVLRSLRRRTGVAGSITGGLTGAGVVLAIFTTLKPSLDAAIKAYETVQVQTDKNCSKKLEEMSALMVESRARDLYLVQKSKQDEQVQAEVKQQIEENKRKSAEETAQLQKAIKDLKIEYQSSLLDCQSKLFNCGKKR